MGIEFINLPSIFKDKSVISFLPTYFENKESSIIWYKYNTPIPSTVFNYNRLVIELYIENSIPDSWNCKDSKYCYQPAGLIVTGYVKIITDSRIWSIICKGPKYRFPLPIDFKSCREEIAGALQEFCYRWCTREHVEYNALNILCIIYLAIVLYGWANPHQISSFICCHEDTGTDNLTKNSIKKYRITKRSGRAKVMLNFKTSG